MFNIFKSKRRPLIGIDISSTSVKILQISGKPGKYQVEAYACGSLPPLSVEGNIIKDVDAVVMVMKRLLTQSHFTTNYAAIAVPDSAVISKVVQLNQGLSESEMEELILIEVDKFIPFPIDEINMDFVTLDSSKNTNMVDVLVVASRAENVDPRVEVISKAGLEPKVVDVESYAIERTIEMLVENHSIIGLDKVLAVIDIGAIYTHLFVLDSGKVVFTREEQFGGKLLIDSIAQFYGVSFEEALALKAKNEFDENYEKQLATPFKESILMQIKRTLQFFYSTSNHGFVDSILLAGGVAKEPGLVEMVQKNIGIPTQLFNPFTNITMSKSVDHELLEKEASSLLLTTGLALRRTRINS